MMQEVCQKNVKLGVKEACCKTKIGVKVWSGLDKLVSYDREIVSMNNWNSLNMEKDFGKWFKSGMGDWSQHVDGIILGWWSYAGQRDSVIFYSSLIFNSLKDFCE